MVKISENQVSTDLYMKPTDRHRYFHYASSYPEYTNLSVAHSHVLRPSYLCFEEKDFDKHINEVKLWFFTERIFRKNLKKRKLRKLVFWIKEI